MVYSVGMDDKELNLAMAKLCGLDECYIEDRRYGIGYKVPGGDWMQKADWNPAEDIQQCFEYVAKAMEGRNWILAFVRFGMGWSAAFVKPEARSIDRWVAAETPALAICEAALKATEKTSP